MSKVEQKFHVEIELVSGSLHRFIVDKKEADMISKTINAHAEFGDGLLLVDGQDFRMNAIARHFIREQ